MEKIYSDLNFLLKDSSLKPCLKNNKTDIQSFLYIKNYNNLVSIHSFLKNKLAIFIETYLPKISYEYKTNRKLNIKLINSIEDYINSNSPKVVKIEQKKKKIPPKSKKQVKYKISSGSRLIKSKKK